MLEHNTLSVEGCRRRKDAPWNTSRRVSGKPLAALSAAQVLDLIEENNTLSVEVRELRSRLAQQAAKSVASGPATPPPLAGPPPEAVAEMQVGFPNAVRPAASSLLISPVRRRCLCACPGACHMAPDVGPACGA